MKSWLLLPFLWFAFSFGPIAAAASDLPPDPSSDEKREAPAQTEEILVEKGGVLLPKGTLVLEPSLQYSHLSRHRISISGFQVLDVVNVGEIAVSDIKRDILTALLTGKYGITSRLEVEAKVPYLYRYDREIKGAGTSEVSARVVDGYGLGDIEGAIYYHLYAARGGGDLILNFRGKSITGRSPYHLQRDDEKRIVELPTGSGHYSLVGGLTAVTTSDPAVFFASLGYYWNIKRSVGSEFGTVDPGDSIEYAFGIAYALSERLSLSTTYQQRVTVGTRQNGMNKPETALNAAVLSMGVSHSLSEESSLHLSVGFGLTVDAPDLQLVLSIPIRKGL